jgi:hypothetical protein
MQSVTVFLGAAIAAILLSRILRIGRRPKNYPPGPPTFPLLGNIHQVSEADASDEIFTATFIHYVHSRCHLTTRISSLKNGHGNMAPYIVSF